MIQLIMLTHVDSNGEIWVGVRQINDVHKKPHVVAEIILTHVSFWFVYVMNMLRVRTCEPRCMPQLV